MGQFVLITKNTFVLSFKKDLKQVGIDFHIYWFCLSTNSHKFISLLKSGFVDAALGIQLLIVLG